jgi:hypothetical protein
MSMHVWLGPPPPVPPSDGGPAKMGLACQQGLDHPEGCDRWPSASRRVVCLRVKPATPVDKPASSQVRAG